MVDAAGEARDELVVLGGRRRQQAYGGGVDFRRGKRRPAGGRTELGKRPFGGSVLADRIMTRANAVLAQHGAAQSLGAIGYLADEVSHSVIGYRWPGKALPGSSDIGLHRI